MNDAKQIRNNHLELQPIAGIPLTMILAATWLWYFVINGDLDLVNAIGTANRGQLVQPPRQLDDVAMTADTGALIKYADLPRKWRLAVVNRGPVCAEACEKNLYLTRQIHVAMGKEFNRIGRLYVSESSPDDTRLDLAALSDERPAPASFNELLDMEHRGTKSLTIAPGSYAALFAEELADDSTWFLVDPGGWVMMSYNGDIHYKDVISDLKFLLKNSSE